jgi:subtilisin family serine protease
VVDTGILASHPDLNVNKTLGRNFTSKDPKAWNDDNGHGTHVAGIIGAVNNNIGMMGGSPSANLIPIKVLNKQGSGSYSDIIAAINYIADWKTKNPALPAVLNMSLGGPPFKPLDDAINAIIGKGVSVVVAAGNESMDARYSSPARIEKAITVGAYDVSTNAMASFSNYGSVIDIWAPGTYIDSTSLNNSYRVLSGTSMATPVVTSVIVNILSQPQYTLYTPQQIKDVMINFAKNPQNYDKTPAVNPPIRLSRSAILFGTTNTLGVYIGNL